MSPLPTLHELIPLLPELVLACGAMAMLMLGVAIGERSAAVVNGFSFIVLLLAGAALSSVPPGAHAMFGGSFVVDDYARFLKLLTLVGSGGRSCCHSTISRSKISRSSSMARSSCCRRSAC